MGRTPLLAGMAVAFIVVIVVAGCASGQPGWTYDPNIGSVAFGFVTTTGPSEAPIASAAETGASVAPGSSSAPGSPSASGSPAVINLVASNITFDQSQLSAPAGAPFAIQFDNQDAGTQHNVAIYTDSSATTNLFRGAIVTGPAQQAYSVPALQPGTYYFRCDIHPNQMNGTFTVH
jgi:plastocyanin